MQKANKNLTDRFLEGIESIRCEPLPESSVLMVKKCLLDYIGVTLAGSALIKDRVSVLLRTLGDYQTEGLLIGNKERCSIQNAILINGINSHYLELDDGIRFGVNHPGTPLFSALIPMAEFRNTGWEDFVIGVLTGYEASIRLAYAMQPYHYSAGYHPTATCGSLGSTIGLAAMLNLSNGKIKDSIGCASVSAGGSLKVLEDTSELKIFNVGKAAQLAFLSVMIAEAGFHGPQDPLNGPSGFLSMMSSAYDESRLIREKGDVLMIEKIYQKAYASCRHTHAAVEASLKIRKQHHLEYDEIKSMRIITYEGVIGKHDIQDIYGEASAKMSIPYSAAVALLAGKTGVDAFEEQYLTNAEILELTRRIEMVPDKYLSSLVPEKRCAIVEVETSDGNMIKEKIEFPKGEPENPLTFEELCEKFSSLANVAGVDNATGEAIISGIFDKEEVDLKHLFSLL